MWDEKQLPLWASKSFSPRWKSWWVFNGSRTQGQFKALIDQIVEKLLTLPSRRIEWQYGQMGHTQRDCLV
jgi:hypothetical protein